jgi:hypothetical protein
VVNAEGDPVSDGDDVTGATTAVFRANALDEPDPRPGSEGRNTPDGPESDPGPGTAWLVVTRGPNAGARLRLDQPTTSAGRHPDSDIFLDDVTVSRRHAEFRLAHCACRVIDVGSLNGTYVNRRLVLSAVLVDGDEVQLGKFRLAFSTTAPEATQRSAT